MKAALLYDAGDLRVESVPRPVPGPGEVLLAITAAGVCGSDVSMFRRGAQFIPGKHAPGPLILGHEFAGVVAEVGAGVDRSMVGQLVACGAGVSCGHCRPCLLGRTNLCISYSTAGVHRSGGLAEYCAIPASICEPASLHHVSGDDAGLAQPMAVAHHCVQRGRVQRGERVLVLGAGGIGTFLTFIAAHAGADVTAFDLDAERLKLPGSWGSQVVLGDAAAPVAAQLADLAPFDVIFEATGAPGPLAAAIELAKGGGRVIVVGLQGSPRELDLVDLVVEEIEIIGTTAHVFRMDIPAALDLLHSRSEGWSDLAPRVLPLDEGAQALATLGQGGSSHAKLLIDPRIEHARDYARM
jgi:(R,R)-butanediol dehydrogenase/meso-butanediol dehydrogenase/diacetyl reductase